jgi:hypothetical protein
VILDAKLGELGAIFDRPDHPAEAFRYTIFKNCHIKYRGGTITLVSVFFDNCTFDITNNERGKELAKRVLASSFAVFSAT